TQFEELSPAKNRSGNRVCQAAEIELIALIHRLVHEERYSIEGARMRIAELRDEGTSATKASEALRSMFLRTLEEELRELHDLLDPAADPRGDEAGCATDHESAREPRSPSPAYPLK